MQLLSGPVRSTRWLGAAFAAACLLAGLGGCVHEGPPLPKTPRGASADGGDIATASDQTQADRLAATRLSLASAYFFDRKQPRDALDEVKLALAARPNYPDAYDLRGLIYAQLNDPAIAEQSFQRARELAPHEGGWMHDYAWFLCGQKRYPEADAEFTRAMAEPGYTGQARTLLAQGVCEARAGHMADAERTLLKAYEQDPANPVTAYNLADVLYVNGQYDRARFYIRRINSKDELVSAQSLWLAARIEHKSGQADQVRELGAQLHKRFPQSAEAAAFDRGRFDE
ncbi:MAG TPA: type IV pilus biogenesis/stability protein PilW [Burkholderiaceae bacterium]